MGPFGASGTDGDPLGSCLAGAAKARNMFETSGRERGLKKGHVQHVFDLLS